MGSRRSQTSALEDSVELNLPFRTRQSHHEASYDIEQIPRISARSERIWFRTSIKTSVITGFKVLQREFMHRGVLCDCICYCSEPGWRAYMIGSSRAPSPQRHFGTENLVRIPLQKALRIPVKPRPNDQHDRSST